MTTAPARPGSSSWTRATSPTAWPRPCTIYVSAMGYPPGTARQRRTLWLDHVRRPGWRAVGWLDPAGALLGIAYGYTGGPGQWWYEEVRRGLRGALHGDGSTTTSSSPSCTSGPTRRARGLGEGLLRALLAGTDRAHGAAVHPGVRRRDRPGRAWQLYRRLGFRDVLRDHRFTGDSRPFAVLGRELPLPPPTDPAPPADWSAPPARPGTGSAPMTR